MFSIACFLIQIESALNLIYSILMFSQIRMVLCIAALALVGCQSNELEREQVSQREDIRELQERIGQLKSDVDMIQDENQMLRDEITQLKRDLSLSQNANVQYQKDIQRLDELVKTLDTAREQDRKIIVDEVSREISRLSKKISSQPSAPKAVSSKAQVEEGLEHIVAKGETLTAIAKAYGVSTQSIMNANKLSKPDLKIGQKLFIPKKSS